MNLESNFNKLPDIDISGSDDFKEIAELVKKYSVIHWKEYINLNDRLTATEDLEEGEEVVDEDAEKNMLPMTHKDKHYVDELSYRVNRDINLVQDIFTKLIQKVIIFTNKDLLVQVKNACKWFNQLKISNYTGVIEHHLNKPKSKNWILHESMKYIKIKPKCIIDYENIKESGTYLIMDDGVYSGTQLIYCIYDIMRKVKKCVIYIAIMYMAEIGLESFIHNNSFDLILKEEYVNTIKYTFKSHSLPEDQNKVIYLWKDFIVIPSIPKILLEFTNDNNFIHKFHSILLENCGSIVIFEHKIPDYKSLPWILSNIFYRSMYKHYLKTPPYNPHNRTKLEDNTNYHFECFKGNAGAMQRFAFKGNAGAMQRFAFKGNAGAMQRFAFTSFGKKQVKRVKSEISYLNNFF